jgi:hypothetical protein
MAWITAKTDWNVDDYYNFDDLNRVENNTDYIYDELVNLGYSPTLSTINTSRTKSSIDYYDDINRIESNIKALADASYDPLGWLEPETDWISVYKVFDYNDANRLESNLVNLKSMIENIDAELEYCGIIISGEDFHLGG